jgi:hypothetical protein
MQKITRGLEAVTARWWYVILLLGIAAISMAPTMR